MKNVYPISLFVLFLLLSMLHFSWGIGSTWGIANALPTNEKGDLLLNPTILDCIIVGLVLLSFAAFYLLQSTLIKNPLAPKFNRIISWVIPSIFLIRAAGDFKHVGIFKPSMDTPFALADTYYYSPLCLVIAGIGYYLVLSLRPIDR